MTVEDLLIIGPVFVAVAVVAGALTATALRQQAPERRRLRAVISTPAARGATVDRPALTLKIAPNRLAQRISRLLPRSPQRMAEMRARLIAAGFRGPAAPVLFAAAQIVAAFAVAILVLLTTGNGSYALFGLAAGFVAPGFWVSHQLNQRRRAIRNGLPDVIDLLIVCLESGASLDQAVLKTSEELGIAYRALADELVLVANEIRAGTPRAEAFKRFAERTGDDDVRSFTGMLIQTDRYGTSIAQALRVHADVLRTRRRQRAEERAAKANVKLVVPLVLCLFPAFYILALGPALLQFARVFMDISASVN